MSQVQIFDCEQGSPEWHACRLGIPTASEFSTVMAKGRDGGVSATRTTYMLKLVGETLTGEVQEGYSNAHMERGKVMEAEARDLYAMLRDVEPQQVGFMRRGEMGASPDSLVGDTGLLEIKTKLPHLHIAALLAGKLPAEHKAQVQGQLLVSGREWCDFVSYWPALPPFIVREYRDEPYLSTLSAAIDKFNAEKADVLARVQSYIIPKEQAA